MYVTLHYLQIYFWFLRLFEIIPASLNCSLSSRSGEVFEYLSIFWFLALRITIVKIVATAVMRKTIIATEAMATSHVGGDSSTNIIDISLPPTMSRSETYL